MTLELKLYLKNNVKPKIKYIICKDNNHNNLILTSNDITYIKGEDNLYNIHMDYVIIKQAMCVDVNDMSITMPSGSVDPNDINFDDDIMVYLYDNISIDDLYNGELWVLPTFGDLKFKLKLVDNICINISN